MINKMSISASNGVEIAIKSGWKHGYFWWCVTDSEQFTEDELVTILFALFLGVEKPVPALFNQLLDFISNKDMAYGHDSRSENVTSTRIFDPILDYNMVLAGFYEIYGLDIEKMEDLHWHTFLVMFDNILTENNLSKITEFRAYRPRKGDSSEKIVAMSRLRDYYSLPDKNLDQIMAESNVALSEMINKIKKAKERKNE